MAGLSAAWRLQKRGFRDFVLLEMEQQPGGNSRWGENEITAYPWAAHYLPVPGPKATLVRELCEELGLLKDGRWEERDLCFSPQERLYIHGRWQEGLEPDLLSRSPDREEFRRFQDKLNEFRASGEFTIPMQSGAKPSALDAISMEQWLKNNGFRSEYLNWYVNYACRDDYGALARDTSAWAGIHYFASREPDDKGPLTWPEGNGWIARRLIDRVKPWIRSGAPVYAVVRDGNRLRVKTEVHRIRGRKGNLRRAHVPGSLCRGGRSARNRVRVFPLAHCQSDAGETAQGKRIRDGVGQRHLRFPGSGLCRRDAHESAHPDRADCLDVLLVACRSASSADAADAA